MSVRRVQQILHNTKHLVYTGLRRATNLTPVHHKCRDKWARAELREDPRWWHRTLFSDEKRFTFDGPDGVHYHWAYTRVQEMFNGRRHHLVVKVMVWAGFCARGKAKPVIVDGTINAVEYVEVLRNAMQLAGNNFYLGSWHIQQDETPAHTAVHTKEYFMEASISVLD